MEGKKRRKPERERRFIFALNRLDLGRKELPCREATVC